MRVTRVRLLGCVCVNLYAGVFASKWRLALARMCVVVCAHMGLLCVSLHARQVTAFAFDLATWMIRDKGLNVCMCAEEELPSGVIPFTPAMAETIDAIVTIGGDGTVLYTSALFQVMITCWLFVAVCALVVLCACAWLWHDGMCLRCGRLPLMYWVVLWMPWV